MLRCTQGLGSEHGVAECTFDSKLDLHLVFMKLLAAQGSSEVPARHPGCPEPRVGRGCQGSPAISLRHPTS